ncbi:MAG: hypothetical protein ACTSWW_08515 [Promethearchaeota archaeon]
MELPFIEIRIISTSEAEIRPIDIMEQLKKELDDCYHLKITLQNHEELPYLYVGFPSSEAFSAAYQRDMDVYGLLINQIENGKIDIQEFQEELAASTEKNPPNEDEDIYIILKYTSNWKEPIRKNYQLTMKVDQIFGVQSSFEEVEDGFLKFYKRRQDFEDSKIDNNSRDGWKKWFELRGFNPDSQFAQTFFAILEEHNIFTKECPE